MKKQTNTVPYRLTALCISLSLAAPMSWSGPLGNAARSTGLLQPVGRAVGLDPVQAIAPIDNLLESGAQGLGLSTDSLQLSPEQLNNPVSYTHLTLPTKRIV